MTFELQVLVDLRTKTNLNKKFVGNYWLVRKKLFVQLLGKGIQTPPSGQT